MSNRIVRPMFALFAVGWSFIDAASATDVTFAQQPNALLVRQDDTEVSISLQRPELIFQNGVRAVPVDPITVQGAIETGVVVNVEYPSYALPDNGILSVVLKVHWSPDERVLRKWAEFKVEGTAQSLRLDEVTLETLPSKAVEVAANPPQSYPAFLRGAFAGIEFPVSTTRIDGDALLLQHRPGVTLRPGGIYTSRTEVIGMAALGEEKAAFMRYVAAHRVAPTGLHINYNSWWTSSVPYSQDEILRLMQVFEEKMTKPHRAGLDTFTIDMGWSDPNTLWGINATMFPRGFTPLDEAMQRVGSRLGLWISPSSCYPPALDNMWAKTQGYETFPGTIQLACLGGERYSAAYRERMVEMVRQFGIRHIKLDGYALTCPESDHGHAPAALSAEAVAEGGLAAFDAVHAAAPDCWLEATCFGWNPSPWWLWHVNSVIGTFGDDAPRGRIPAPVYRESYTTARDFFNLQGATHIVLPAAAQEVLGVIHQTRDPFLNDAVVAIMRGHGFLPLYVNPAFMDTRRWQDLAGALKWARNHPLVFSETRAIPPPSWRDGKTPVFANEAPMPREPYGYDHGDAKKRLVLLRNPWIVPCTVPLALSSYPMDAPAGSLNAVSLYPESRLYGHNLSGADSLTVPLAPYETVVLAIDSDTPVQAMPEAAATFANVISLANTQSKVTRIVFESSGKSMGDDWMTLADPGSEALELHVETHVHTSAPDARLLVLLEGKNATPSVVRATATQNGQSIALDTLASDQGWCATGLPNTGERWVYLGCKLPVPDAAVSLDVFAGKDTAVASAWIWATKPGEGAATSPDALPSPELISLDAQPVLTPIEVTAIAAKEARVPEIERIDGIYLDALKPVSATVGWGSLQINRSITETPLAIGGRTFRRGLGVHAVSHVSYDLDGKFGRFQAWVGPNAGIGATVSFEVWADGSKRWESGNMGASDQPKAVEVDIHGVKTLELVVGDGGNGIGADHANWADAKVLH